MARISFKNLEEYEIQLGRLAKDTEKIAGRAIYEGAKIVTDQIAQNIRGLPVIRGYGTASDPLPGGVTAAQKRGLLDGLGIAKLQNDAGYINVKIGFDGYNATRTKDYPQGQPNQLVARGLESGTSWKQKKPFVRPAINASKSRAEAEMARILDEEIEKITKG